MEYILRKRRAYERYHRFESLREGTGQENEKERKSEENGPGFQDADESWAC